MACMACTLLNSKRRRKCEICCAPQPAHYLNMPQTNLFVECSGSMPVSASPKVLKDNGGEINSTSLDKVRKRTTQQMEEASSTVDKTLSHSRKVCSTKSCRANSLYGYHGHESRECLSKTNVCFD